MAVYDAVYAAGMTFSFPQRDVWTLPVGGGLGKIIKFGKLPVNISMQAYTNTKQPHVTGPDWTLRTQIQFLFPK